MHKINLRLVVREWRPLSVGKDSSQLGRATSISPAYKNRRQNWNTTASSRPAEKRKSQEEELGRQTEEMHREHELQISAVAGEPGRTEVSRPPSISRLSVQPPRERTNHWFIDNRSAHLNGQNLVYPVDHHSDLNLNIDDLVTNNRPCTMCKFVPTQFIFKKGHANLLSEPVT